MTAINLNRINVLRSTDHYSPADMPDKLNWLQAGRGLAALMVLFFHMAPHWALVPALTPLTPLMQWGFSGVDVFFVISGFVVYQSGVHSVAARGLVDFLKKRFARIYFNYWPAFIAITIISIVILDTYPKSLEQTTFSFFLLYPKFWDNWIASAWTLTYELYFYFILGIILLTKIEHHRKILSTLIAGLFVWHFSWFYFSPDHFYKESIPLTFILNGFTVEFLFGACIAIAFKNHKNLFNATWINIALAWLIIIAGFYISTHSVFFTRIDILRTISFGLAAAALVFLLLTLENSKFKPPKMLVAIGDCSFSLYLFHGTLLGVFGWIRYRFVGDDSKLLGIYSILMPILIIVISYAWYSAIENRAMKLSKKI